MPQVSTFKQKALASALVALTLGAGIAVQPNAAEARSHRHGWAGAGIIGGLALGAMMAGAAQANQGYYVDPGYEAGPVYDPAYGAAPVYDEGYPTYRPHRAHRAPVRMEENPTFAYKGPNCTLRRQSWFDGYAWRVQKVPVCDR